MSKDTDQSMNEEFDDFLDREYYEMVELIEKMKKGEISAEEMKKLKYIYKTRENLFGGDV